MDGMSGDLARDSFGQSDSANDANSPSGDFVQNPIAAALEQAWHLSLGDLSREVNQHIASAYLEPLSLDHAESTIEKIVVRGPSRLICN